MPRALEVVVHPEGLHVRHQDAALTIQPTGQPALRLYPRSESQWFTMEIDARIEFQDFGDGQADSLVLVQNGRAMPAARVECGNQ